MPSAMPVPESLHCFTATEADKAYAGGYFEGRGYFKITMHGGKGGGPRVRVAVNVHHSQALWFVERWGGKLQRYNAGATTGVNTLTRYGHLWCTWSLTFDDAKRFLIDIAPFLHRKAKAAKLCACYLHTLSKMPVKLKPHELRRLHNIALWADKARMEATET